MFRNMVLRRVFVHTRDEVAGGWEKLCNEELYNVYCSADTVRMKLSVHVARVVEVVNVYSLVWECRLEYLSVDGS
jgi:hypothetical protein